MIRSQYSRIAYAANFGELLSVSVETAERPKPMPSGPYLAVVTKFEPGESRDKKTPFIRFHHRVLQARDGVDMDQLAQTGDYSERTFRSDFYLTKDALYRLRDYLEKSLKVDTTGRSFAQCLPETVGKQVVINLKQSPSSKPGDDTIYNEIESFQPVEY